MQMATEAIADHYLIGGFRQNTTSGGNALAESG
jgi:hypothetical protein